MTTTSPPKTYVFDLDGTICTEEKTFERGLFAKPISRMIDVIFHLYRTGNTIIIYTARGWPEYKMTKLWLKEHGVPHHELIMGKPWCDVFVDDRAIHPDEFLRNLQNDQ